MSYTKHESLSIPNLDLNEKIGKVVINYALLPILALFCNLVALILGLNCIKGLRVTKIVKQIKFEGVCGELGAKNCLQR